MAYNPEAYRKATNKLLGINTQQDEPNAPQGEIVETGPSIAADAAAAINEDLPATQGENAGGGGEYEATSDAQEAAAAAIEDLDVTARNPDEVDDNPGVDPAIQAENEKGTLAPFKEAVERTADNPDAFLNQQAQSIRASALYRNYIYTPAEKVAKAREMGKALGMPAGVILEDDTTYKNTQHAYDYYQKSMAVTGSDTLSLKSMMTQFPELRGMHDMDEEELSLVLHDMESVHRIHGLINNALVGWEQGKKKAEHDLKNYKVYEGKANKEQRDQAYLSHQELNNPLNRLEPPEFLDSPLESAVGGAAQSLSMMIEGYKGNVVGGITSALMATYAAVVATSITSGAGNSGNLADAWAFGWKLGAMVGGIGSLSKLTIGESYADKKYQTTKSGMPLYNDNEIKEAATIEGLVNASVENWSNQNIAGLAMPKTALAEKAFKETMAVNMLQANASRNLSAQAKSFVKEGASDFGKALLGEITEEGEQSLTSDLSNNYLVYKTGKGEYVSRFDMARNAFNSSVDAIPTASFLVGTSGAGGATLGINGISRQMFRAYNNAQYNEKSQQTIVGMNLLANIQAAVADSKLKDLAPDVQKKIIRNEAEDTDFKLVYIDTESALQKETGRDSLQKVADAAGYDSDALQTAIEQGKLIVPLEVYAQSEADPDLLSSVSFSKEAPSIEQMKRDIQEAFTHQNEMMKEAIERQKKLMDQITKEYFPDDKEGSDMAAAAIYENAANPAQGLKTIEKRLLDDRNAILKPAMDALARGSNEEWRKNFRETFKREPNEKELRNMATDLMSGFDSAPEIDGWSIDPETSTDVRDKLAAINGRLAVIERTKEKISTLTNAEIKLTEGMTPEAFSVYRTLFSELSKGPGTSSRAARMNAILFARHADNFARVISEKTGRNFTAKDYYQERFALGFDGQQQADALNQEVVNEFRPEINPVIREQMEAIKQSYTNEDGTMKEGWMKAPNGKPTNLTEEQWLITRTSTFNKWFGNWEAAAKKNILRNREPVKLNLDKDLYSKLPVKLIRKYLKGDKQSKSDIAKAVRPLIPLEVPDTPIGTVKISNNSISDTLHHSNGMGIIATLPIIDKLLKNSIEVGSRTIENNKTSHILAAPLEADGKYAGTRFVVLMVVNEDRNGMKFYDHELTTIKKLDEMPAVAHKTVKHTEVGHVHQAVTDIINEEVWSVNENDVSKVVDENGEPLVVYHGGTFAVNADNNIAKSGMHFGTKKAALDRIFEDKLIQQEADKVKVKEVVAPQPFMTGVYEYSYNGYTIKEEAYIKHQEGDDWYYFPDKIKEKIREKIFYEHGSAGISLIQNIENFGNVAVKPYFLNIKNIKNVKDVGYSWDEEIEKGIKEKVDGLSYTNEEEDKGSTSYVIFNSNQVKSATQNNGNFDANDANIYHQIIGENGAAALDRQEEVTTRLDNLSVARQMEEAGKDAQAIKLATGWERGADKLWKYEVPDAEISRECTLKKSTLKKKLKDNEKKKQEIEEKTFDIAQNHGKNSPEAKELFEESRSVNAEGARLNSAIALQEAMESAKKGEAYNKEVPLSSLFGEDALFKAYPQLSKINVALYTDSDTYVAGYTKNDTRTTIGINIVKQADLENVRKTLLHEAQHAIQDIEGFARGSSVEEFTTDDNAAARDLAVGELQDKMNRQATSIAKGLLNGAGIEDDSLIPNIVEALITTDKTLEEIVSDFNLPEGALWHVPKDIYSMLFADSKEKLAKTKDKYNPVNRYKRSMGETEARNVERRMDMSWEDRQKTLLKDTEDVAREDQIFLRNEHGETFSQMAGVKAKNAPLEKLEQAKAMYYDIKSADEIWKETGWKLGADEKWRYEIPDNITKINLDHFPKIEGVAASLDSLYDNPQLYEAYPFLRKIYVAWKDLGFINHIGNTAIHHDNIAKSTIQLNINVGTDEAIKSALIHEIQHLIQEYEGFAGGGNSEEIKTKISRELDYLEFDARQTERQNPKAKELVELWSKIYGEEATPELFKKEDELTADEKVFNAAKELDNIYSRIKHLKNALAKDDYRIYRDLAGEQEARATAERASRLEYDQEDLNYARKHYSDAMHNYWEELKKVDKATHDLAEEWLTETMQSYHQDYEEAKAEELREKEEKVKAVSEKLADAMGEVDWYYSSIVEANRKIEEELAKAPTIHDSDAIIVFNGEEYTQQMNSGIKGSFSPLSNGQRLIQLFSTADESTFLHEMGHLFLTDLEDLAQIDEVSAKELATVREWATWKKGDSRKYQGTPWSKEFSDLEKSIIAAEEAGDTITAEAQKRRWTQERFARGFEIYLKDGKAPAKGLQAVFRKFASFLRQIYTAFISDGARASADVEAIMARMIATDEEIEAMALDDQFKDIEKAGGEKLLNETERETYERWLNEAKEEAKEKLQKIVMADLTEKKRQEMLQLKKEERAKEYERLEQEPVYLARAIIDKLGGSVEEAMPVILDHCFPDRESFEAADKAAPPIDEAVQQHLEDWQRDYDEQNRKEISEEEVREAMESSVYHRKAKAMESAALSRKLDAKRKITGKVDKAIQNINDAIDSMPEDTDLKVDKYTKRVKTLIQKVNELRFATRWNSNDFKRLDQMLKSTTPAEMKELLADFTKNLQQQKLNINDVEKANEGRQKMYAEMARKAAEDKPIYNATNIGEYRRNQRKAESRVLQMIKAGRFELALQQTQQAALSAAMAKEAEKAKEEVDKLIKHINQQLGAKTVKLPAKERYWHRHIAYLLGIGLNDAQPPVLKDGQKLGSIRDLIDDYKARLDLTKDYDADEVIEFITGTAAQQSYQALTIGQLRQAAQLLDIIYKCGKDTFALKTVSGMTIEDVVKEVLADEVAIAKEMNVKKRRIQSDVGGLGYNEWLGKIPAAGDFLAKEGQKYLTTTLKPEKIIELLGKSAYKYIFGTFDEAASREADMMAKATTDLQRILKDFSHQERRDWKKRTYKLPMPDGEVVECSKENIICMALNLGTEKNRQRLTGGFFGVDRDNENNRGMLTKFITDHMTKKDWLMVQGIWDYLNTYWEDTVKVEQELNGMQLEAQKPTPFSVLVGEEKIDLAGGYYPVAFNIEKNDRAGVQAQDDVAKQMGGSAKVLGTGRSHTKARVDTDVFRELQLTFDVIPKHINQVIHNITTRIPARDVYRLLNDRELSQHISDRLGRPVLDMLRKWALDVWTQLPEKDMATNFVERHMGALRRNSTFAIMAYRIWPVVENLSNYAVVADKLGHIKTLSAIADFYGNIKDFRLLLDKSSMMRNRLNNLDRDIRSTPGLFEADHPAIEIIREHGYDLMTYSDLMFSAPLWCRAYKDVFQDTLSEVVEENTSNKIKVQKAQNNLDKLRGELIEANSDIDAWYAERRNRKNAGQVDWQPGTSRFAVMGHQEFTEQLEDLKNRKDELGLKIWEAEAEFGRAIELKIYDDAELVKEAEHRAAMKADAVIRDAFGSGRTVDLPAAQRSYSELVKAMTTFYSFFNTQFNALYFSYIESRHGRKVDDNPGTWARVERWAPFAKAIMHRILLVSLIGSLLKMATKTDGGDDRDKYRKVMKDGKEVKEEIPWLQRFLKVFAKNSLGTATGSLYGVRDLANIAMNLAFDGTDYGRGVNFISTPFRSVEEGFRTIKLIAAKSERDAKIEARKQQEAAKLKKMTGKQRRKYLEEQKYKKPLYPITYEEIFRHGANALAGFTSAKTGVSSTVIDAVTGTMQYLLDTDNRYDKTWRNIIWSAIFDKKPVENEPPEKPEKKKPAKRRR